MYETSEGNTRQSIMQRLAGYSLKQWILFGIAALTSLFLLIGLAFPVLDVSIFSLKSKTLGFDLLGGHMPAALESVAAALVLFAWVNLIAMICCFVFTMLSLLKFSGKKSTHFQIIVMVVAIIASLLYMISGFIAVSAMEISTATTSAYVLFILVALFAVAYFICLKVLPESRGKSVKGESRKPHIDVAEELKKYKELYDMCAITEEEYNRKKAELLNQ